MLVLFFLLLVLPPVFFVLIRSKIKSYQPPSRVFKKIMLGFYIFLILLFAISLIGDSYYLYLKGYRSTSILFVLMSLIGIIYWLVDRRKVTANIARFLVFLFSLISLSFASLLTFEIIGDYKNQLVYNDSNYRLEESGRAIMNPCTLPTLFVKHRFYEKKYLFEKESQDCLSKPQIKKVKIEILPDQRLLVTYVLDTSSELYRGINPVTAIYYPK